MAFFKMGIIMKFHYTYMITELSTNMKYIGVRSCNIEIDYDIGKQYFSSSRNKEFVTSQKLNNSNYKYDVLSTHETREAANYNETILHSLYDVSCSPDFYNRTNASMNSVGYDATNKAVLKDKDGNIGVYHVNDKDYINGLLVGVNKGYTVIYDGVCFKRARNEDKGDYPAYISNIAIIEDNTIKMIHPSQYNKNSMTHINKNKVCVKDKAGNVFQVNNDDANYKNNNFVSYCKGYITVKDINNNTSRIHIDDTRLHVSLFALNKDKVLVKDKLGQHLMISKNDDRYNNELVSPLKSSIIVRDTNGNMFYADRHNIPDNCVIGNTGIVYVTDTSGNMFSVSNKDSRYLNGELKLVSDNTIIGAFDKQWNHYLIKKDDPRYIAGELIKSTSYWIVVDDVIMSVQQAAKLHNISTAAVRHRLKSTNFNNWIKHERQI